LELIVTKNGPNWVFQKTDPAYLREPKPAVGKGEIIYYHPANVVCGATSGNIQVSPQGESWNAQTNPIEAEGLGTGVYGSVQDEHVFFASTGNIIKSNGINPWVRQPLNNDLFGVGWSASAYDLSRHRYVGIGNSGPSYRVGYSDDGETWVAIAPPVATFYSDLIYLQNTDRLFATADTAILQPMAASDNGGETWTMKNSPDSGSAWRSLSYSEDLSKIVTFAAAGTSRCATSITNGESWTIRTLPTSNVMESTARSDELGLYVAVGGGGSTPRFLYSEDGETWEAADSEPTGNNTWDVVRWSSRQRAFFATSTAGSADRQAKSVDGKNWTAYTSTLLRPWNALSVR
jgi:hypothetical protein